MVSRSRMLCLSETYGCYRHPQLSSHLLKNVSRTLNLEDAIAVSSLIDHTLLKPDATESQIAQLCSEAIEWEFASVCVNPCWVSVCAQALAGSPVHVCTVIGFPLGANTSAIKLAEAEVALLQGALELDVVQNIGALLSGLRDVVQKEIADLAVLAHNRDAILKVILETALLSDDEKIAASLLAVESGTDFVKTSTGFASSGATIADVKLLRRTVGPSIGVKASGGVRTLETVRDMVTAGATRIGTSSGVAILRELRDAVPEPQLKAGY